MRQMRNCRRWSLIVGEVSIPYWNHFRSYKEQDTSMNRTKITLYALIILCHIIAFCLTVYLFVLMYRRRSVIKKDRLSYLLIANAYIVFAVACPLYNRYEHQCDLRWITSHKWLQRTSLPIQGVDVANVWQRLFQFIPTPSCLPMLPNSLSCASHVPILSSLRSPLGRSVAFRCPYSFSKFDCWWHYLFARRISLRISTYQCARNTGCLIRSFHDSIRVNASVLLLHNELCSQSNQKFDVHQSECKYASWHGHPRTAGPSLLVRQYSRCAAHPCAHLVRYHRIRSTVGRLMHMVFNILLVYHGVDYRNTDLTTSEEVVFSNSSCFSRHQTTADCELET